MKTLKITVGILLCIAGLFMMLTTLSMGLSESDLLHDMGAILTVSIFSVLGIALIALGAKLAVPKKNSKRTRHE